MGGRSSAPADGDRESTRFTSVSEPPPENSPGSGAISSDDSGTSREHCQIFSGNHHSDDSQPSSCTALVNDTDAETAALICQLQLDDIDEIRDSDKGKGREGELSDEQQSLLLLKTELKNQITSIHDGVLCRSMANAIVTDHNIIQQSIVAEDLATRDREIALGMADQRNSRPTLAITEHGEDACTKDEFGNEYVAKLAMLYHGEEAARSLMQDDSNAGGEQGEPAAAAATRTQANIDMERICVVCEDTSSFAEIARLPCQHEYCKNCLEELFATAMRDEAYFPPRCCRQLVPLERVKVFLDPKLVEDFTRIAPELETPNRTYCHKPDCTTWIPPSNIDLINEVGVCPACNTETCIMCKGTSHDGDCPADAPLQQVLGAARENGWQRCYHCRALVDLAFGCNHITCRCKAEFCYVCAAKWKTCPCDQWEERRLYARAGEIVNREQPRGARQPAAANAVRDMARRLRRNHNCDHTRWEYIEGRAQCEECSDTLPHYIFQCQQCHIRACHRCRRNRL